MSILGWIRLHVTHGISPDERAESEVEDLERRIYDAEKTLHDAEYTLRFLKARRDFLLNNYDAGITDQAPTAPGGLFEVAHNFEPDAKRKKRGMDPMAVSRIMEQVSKG